MPTLTAQKHIFLFIDTCKEKRHRNQSEENICTSTTQRINFPNFLDFASTIDCRIPYHHLAAIRLKITSFVVSCTLFFFSPTAGVRGNELITFARIHRRIYLLWHSSTDFDSFERKRIRTKKTQKMAVSAVPKAF